MIEHEDIKNALENRDSLRRAINDYQSLTKKSK
jgi:hypothetical protein